MTHESLRLLAAIDRAADEREKKSRVARTPQPAVGENTGSGGPASHGSPGLLPGDAAPIWPLISVVALFGLLFVIDLIIGVYR